MKDSASPLLRRLVCFMLSGAMVLSSVPTQAIAEAAEEVGAIAYEGEGDQGEEATGIEEPVPAGEPVADADIAEDEDLPEETIDWAEPEAEPTEKPAEVERPAAAEPVEESGEEELDESENETDNAILPQEAGDAMCGGVGTCSWEVNDGVLTIYPGTVSEAWYSYEDLDWVHPWPWRTVHAVRMVAEKGNKVILPPNSGHLFSGMKYLTWVDLTGADASQVTSMVGMFVGCPYLSSVNLSGWDTSSVVNMSAMFNGCSSLSSVDLSGWDTSHVEDMSLMFMDCSSLSNLEVTKWATSSVKSMWNMFNGCSNLSSLDLSGWDMSSADVYGMFNRCNSFATIKVGKRFWANKDKDEISFPSPLGSEDGLWRSTADGGTYTKSEIITKRFGVEDTYTADVPAVYPAGYDFSKDSFPFGNFKERIWEPYFRTLFEDGTAMFLLEHGKDPDGYGSGGNCYGIATTTAAVLNGLPSVRSFKCIMPPISKYEIPDWTETGIQATKLRDLWRATNEDKLVLFNLLPGWREVVGTDDPTSSALGSFNLSGFWMNDEIGYLSTDDYIKFSHISWLSSENIHECETNEGRGAAGLLNDVRKKTDSGAVGIVIYIGGREHGPKAHAVLAVGYQGNDILIDDPEFRDAPQKLSINADGSWSYHAPHPIKYDSTNSRLMWSTRFADTYNALSSGRSLTYSSTPQLEQYKHLVSAGAFIEGANEFDRNNSLISIKADTYVLGDGEYLSLPHKCGRSTDDSPLFGMPEFDDNVFWALGTNNVTVDSLEGESCGVEFGADDLLLSINVDGGSAVSASIEGKDSTLDVSTEVGNPVAFSFESIDDDGDRVIVSITGIASSEEISSSSEDGGYVIAGLLDVTARIKTEEGEDVESSTALDGQKIKVLVDASVSDVTISPVVAAESVSLNKSTVKLAAAGEKCTLVATVLPTDTTDASVIWSSSNPSVATVSSDGTVKAIANGSATISASTTNGRTASCEVTVSIDELSSRFPDVKPGSWYYKVVNRAADLGLVTGYANGYFGPDDSITRGQVAVILWRMAGQPRAGSSAKSFSDVTKGKYYYDAVRWASSAGVVSGYASGKFGPNDKVTREQLAVMLSNYAGKVAGKKVTGSKADFSSMKDASKVAGYAQPAVGWCFRNKILSGSQGNVLPKGNATRAQAAKMLVFLYDMVSAASASA